MPFFHSTQMDVRQDPRQVESGTDAEKAILAASNPIAELAHDTAWRIRNKAASGAQWLTLDDQDFYVPHGRVVAVSVGLMDYTGTPDSFYSLHFDMPYPNPRLYRASDATTHPAAHGNYDWFPTGGMKQCWITRIRFTALTTATKITLYG